MRAAVERIADAVKKYANQQGWAPRDYQAFARINEGWWQVHVVIAATRFREPDDQTAWRDASKLINDQLGELSEILTSVSLSLVRTDDPEGWGASMPDFVPLEVLLAGNIGV
jgi:hypothetical protein